MLRAALVLALLVGHGCRSASPEARPLPPVDESGPLLEDGPRSPRAASYRIEAELYPDTHRIEGRETLTWRNTSGTAVKVLPFHLYMNAFKSDETLFMQEAGGALRDDETPDESRGWIEVASIQIDGEDLGDRARYPGPDETVLEVPLEAPLHPGETIKVDLEFTVELPEAIARTGYVGAFHMVAQWFPKIGVLVGEPGKERWHAEPFRAKSEFFADFGTYDVELTVPSSYVVAATGVLTGAREREGGRKALHYRAEDVHDFAWAADPYLEWIAGPAHTESGPVEVRVYFRPPQRRFAHRHLEAGIRALELFSRHYLPYPWRRLTIIDPPPRASDRVGGMEYPTLVTTAGDSVFFPEGVYVPEMVTIHEVGHNWFQGILASNEVDEAWLDEGLDEYASGLVMEELYGARASLVDYGGLRGEYFALHRALTGDLSVIPDRITKPSYRFADFSSYAAATYTKTALALRTLENVVGSEHFRAALKTYATRFAFRHPTGADFFDTLEEQLGQDLDWFLEPAFFQRGVADFRVRDVDCRRQSDSGPFACEVLVVNLGQVRVPVDVELRFADGARTTLRWDDLGPHRRFEIERTSPIESVQIDPQDRVPLDAGGLEGSYRVVPDRSASAELSARAQFWTQTLMQVTGL